MLFSDRETWFRKAACTGHTSVFFPEVCRGQAAR